MKNPVLFWIQAFLLVIIALCHAYALAHDTYWYFPILNRVIHFAGGVWVALVSVWLLAYLNRGFYFARVIAILLAISIAWEIFEVAIGVAQYEDKYAIDTTLDLIMDLLGGAVGYLAARALMSRDTITVQ